MTHRCIAYAVSQGVISLETPIADTLDALNRLYGTNFTDDTPIVDALAAWDCILATHYEPAQTAAQAMSQSQTSFGWRQYAILAVVFLFLFLALIL